MKGGFGDAYMVLVQLELDEKTPYLDRLFLNPLAWQAVGKTRGWGNGIDCCTECGAWLHGWQYKLHRLIDGLAGGKTIEEALAAINP